MLIDVPDRALLACFYPIDLEDCVKAPLDGRLKRRLPDTPLAGKVDLLCEAYAVAVELLESFGPLREPEKRQLVSSIVHTFMFEGITDVPQLAKTGAMRLTTLYGLTKLPKVH